jgi:large subunit ribosomal protein L17
MAKAVLICQRIMTTKAKAKEARKLVDQLITLGKNGTLADKRRAFAILCDHQLVSNLFGKTSPRFNNRNGGYTRIIQLGTRRGDNAQLVYLELTEKEEVIVSKPKSTGTAKVKKVSEGPKETKATKHHEDVQDAEISSAPEEVKESPKKEAFKQPGKELPTAKDKKLAGKQFMGGLRRMFQRKAPGQ